MVSMGYVIVYECGAYVAQTVSLSPKQSKKHFLYSHCWR